MKKEITYAWLDETLTAIGLIFTKNRTHGTRKEDERKKIVVEASVVSETDPVMIRKGAVYQDLRASGHNPDKVAQDIYEKMTTSDFVLIGTYDDYKEKVILENGSFKRITLSKDEVLDLNLPY